MEYRILGKTGLKISRLGLGGIPIQKIDKDGARALISEIQAFLPLDKSTKGILFVTFFGLAKVFQYSAIAVLGVKGWQKFKTKLGIKRQETKETETTDTYTSKQQY